MTFASDAFTAADSTLLTDHSASWVVMTGYTGIPRITANRLRGDGSANAVYRYDSAAPSADYEVSADCYVVSSAANAGVIGRASSSAATFYMARWNSTGGFQLYKVVSGTTTQLGSSFAASYSAGQTFRVRLRMEGTTISLYRDVEGSPLISVTDSAISAAGFAGIWTIAGPTAGPHLDNWDASELAGGGGSAIAAILSNYKRRRA